MRVSRTQRNSQSADRTLFIAGGTNICPVDPKGTIYTLIGQHGNKNRLFPVSCRSAVQLVVLRLTGFPNVNRSALTTVEGPLGTMLAMTYRPNWRLYVADFNPKQINTIKVTRYMKQNKLACKSLEAGVPAKVSWLSVTTRLRPTCTKVGGGAQSFITRAAQFIAGESPEEKSFDEVLVVAIKKLDVYINDSNDGLMYGEQSAETGNICLEMLLGPFLPTEEEKFDVNDDPRSSDTVDYKILLTDFSAPTRNLDRSGSFGSLTRNRAKRSDLA
uniref:Uncharacterized protein n=1 Tax=Anopheles atroparvus TaxID=41427 RepID=A0A182IR58_ANOAO